MEDFLRAGTDIKRLDIFLYKESRVGSNTQSRRKIYDRCQRYSYFRTLHSFAFRTLGMKKECVMKSPDYRDFGVKMGIPIKTAWYSQEDGIFNSDNEYLRLINKARVLEIPVLDLYDKK